ncbi:hypothetical protein K1719_045648 [Acacia pycnantha]|nr:hypothetical protein K1719_045648 [Acacia pycnantha]
MTECLDSEEINNTAKDSATISSATLWPGTPSPMITHHQHSSLGGRSGASMVFSRDCEIGACSGSGEFIRDDSERILGVLLLFAGIELAMASMDMNTKQESFVMLVCAAVSLIGSSAALGFGSGMVLYLLLKLRGFDWSSCNSNMSKSSGEE